MFNNIVFFFFSKSALIAQVRCRVFDKLHCMRRRTMQHVARVLQLLFTGPSAATILTIHDLQKIPFERYVIRRYPILSVDYLVEIGNLARFREKNAPIFIYVDQKVHRPPLSDIRAAPFLVTGFRCGILDAMKLCRLSGVRS